MGTITLHQLLTLIFCAVVNTLPANTISNPSIALIDPSTLYIGNLNVNPPSVPRNNTSSRIRLPATTFCTQNSRNGLQAPVEIYDYHVANTRTDLRITYCPGLLLEPIAMGNTLGVAYTAMSDQLRLSGDGQLLPPNWDPYTTPRVTGVNCKFEAEGLDHPRTHRRLHVTFRTMLNTINGLTDFLFNGERFGSVIVQVMDDGVQPDGEIIGTVRLYPYEDPSQSMDSGY